MTTKIAAVESAVVQLTELVSSLVSEVRELKATRVTTKAGKKGKSAAKAAKALSVSVEQANSLTAEHFKTLRYSLVERDGEKLVVKDNQYVLVDGAEFGWYRGLKGLQASVEANGAISTTKNAKTGRSQMDFARELLSEMTDAGFAKISVKKATK